MPKRNVIAPTPAIAELESALDVVETNAPINEREGEQEQARLERENARSYRRAIQTLTAEQQRQVASQPSRIGELVNGGQAPGVGMLGGSPAQNLNSFYKQGKR